MSSQEKVNWKVDGKVNWVFFRPWFGLLSRLILGGVLLIAGWLKAFEFDKAQMAVFVGVCVGVFDAVMLGVTEAVLLGVFDGVLVAVFVGV